MAVTRPEPRNLIPGACFAPRRIWQYWPTGLDEGLTLWIFILIGIACEGRGKQFKRDLAV